MLVTLFAISIFDWHFHRIPNRLVFILFVMAFPIYHPMQAGPYFLFFIGLYFLADSGAGDLKYGVALAVIHPPQDFSSFFLLFSISVLVTYLMKRSNRSIPLAPAITIATLFNM